MSFFVVVIDKDKVDVSVIGAIHKILGGSLADIKSALDNSSPIVGFDLFYGSYEEKSKKLREIIQLVRSKGLSGSVYELRSEQGFYNKNDLPRYAISFDILENIINSSDEELQRQLDTDF